MLQFRDGIDLQAWLQDKPAEWAQAVAVRSALRVFPLVFSVAHLPASKSSVEQTQGVLLSAWRALYVSWAACKYPARDMRAAAETAGNARDAYPARSAAAAARHASRAASRAASGIAAADIAIAAAIIASNATDAATKNITPDANAEIWAAISVDCQWLSNGGKGLIERPLWPSDVRGNSKLKANFPPWARAEFDAFADGDLVKTTSWRLIAAWYRAILPSSMNGKPQSLWGESIDVEIATQPDEFWTREPRLVLDAIAEIVPRAVTARAGEAPQDTSTDTEPNRPSFRNKVDAEAVGKALSDNRQPLLFSLASLQQQIAEFRERVRGNNQLDLDFKNEFLEFLDELNKCLEDLANLIPLTGEEPVPEENASAASKWLAVYKERVLEGLKDYCAPANVADTTLPAGVILGCGTVGALVAGPVGFGAGAFFGQLVIRHAKPGTIGDKLKEAIEAEMKDAPQE